MRTLHVIMIKPTRYDDDGYPIQWWRSVIPSNSLACVAALVEDARERRILGGDVEIASEAIDEANVAVWPERIIARARRPDVSLLVMLVGVQTNQFPRAMDIARPFRQAGVQVCIGGFHVSGCVAMLGPDAEALAPARALGVSLFAGEAEEHRLDQVLRDAYAGALKPLYDHSRHTPSLGEAPPPILDPSVVARSIERWSSFDLGRGCPFECSFCTIINVQGRTSRFRDVDALERIVRENHANGVTRFFVTDDNLARNRNWEAYADRLIQLRESENIRLRLIIQVDALAHHIPGFIDKMYRAGAHIIFIGLENINPDNLERAKKRQNRIEEYREMLLAWKRKGVIIVCGYIVGFPNDTRESLLRDIDLIKAQLPIDLLYLNYLTPPPGCEDHKTMVDAGAWMDPDFNHYDLNHRVTHHPKMSDADWELAYREAHWRFYSHSHMARIFRRMLQMETHQPLATLKSLLIYREGPRLERVAFSEFGVVRMTRRRQRRHGLPLEHPLVFYPRLAAQALFKTACYALTYSRLRLDLARARMGYRAGERHTDAAIAPLTDGADPLVVQTAARSTPVAQRRQDIRLRRRTVQENPGAGEAA